MRLLALLFLGICFFQPEAFAKHYSSQQIEKYIQKIPREAENNLSTLSKYLSKPFDDDYDKAKAIAFWIASRIHYDDYLYNNGKTTKLIKMYDPQEPRELLKSRVGICGDFANLFVELCKKVGIKAKYVSGYAYPSGVSLTVSNKHNAGHAWNYFLYDGKKIYVDTTFMAKGSTGISGRSDNLHHRWALNDIKKENRRKSVINEFDKFYFDFTYKDEVQKKHYQRKEK